MKNILIRQHDSTDCAVACIAMICLYYGKSVSISRIREISGTDKKGSTLLGIETAFQRLGFISKSIRVDRKNFISKFTLPAMAHIITKEGLTHFVVLRKINDKFVWVSDPAKGNEKLSVDEFFESFDGVVVMMIPGSEFITLSEDKGSTLKYFFNLINAQKRLFIYAIISSLILTLFGIVSSFFNKYLMDEILAYGLANELKVYFLSFFIISTTQICIGFIRSHLILYLSQKIDIPLILGYFKHVLFLPVDFFFKKTTGDILTRFSDSFTIKNVVTEIYLTIIIDIVMTIASSVILYNISSKLFMIVIFITIFSAVLIYIFKHPYKKINIEGMEQSSRLNSLIIESLKGIETIKSNSNEERILEKLEHEYIKSLRIIFKQGFLVNIQSSVSSIISIIGNLILMYVGSMSVINGNITLGTLLSFASLTNFFMEPIGRIIKTQISFQEASISMKRISEILEVKEEGYTDNGKLSFEAINQDILLNNITFRYGYRDIVLKNINMKIPYGKKTAIVGESGSGKTTISKLLLKFFVAESGQILINNKDISLVSVKSLRKNISYVSQNVELFSGTIAENLKLGNGNASIEDIEYACSISECNEFIEKMSYGYNSFLNEAGGGLSGGERQRLAIARAILKKGGLIILDEATSNLDFLSENRIYKNLFSKVKNSTMVIIAHRLSTIKDCDVIYVMKDGEIKEEGIHSELLDRKGIYFNLWNVQSGVCNEDVLSDKCFNNHVHIQEDESVMTY